MSEGKTPTSKRLLFAFLIGSAGFLAGMGYLFLASALGASMGGPCGPSAGFMLLLFPPANFVIGLLVGSGVGNANWLRNLKMVSLAVLIPEAALTSLIALPGLF